MKRAARRAALFALLVLTLILSIPAVASCDTEEIQATITFCSKVGKASGKLYGVADTFTQEEEARVRGVVDLENVQPGEEVVVHVLWVKPDGKDAFVKRVELIPDGPQARVKTSLTISPSRRPPGTYHLKVYLFRKLLTEKTVELVLPE